jgi:hypothetical protein
MRHALTGLLSTAAISAALSASPVAAQVAGNPGDQHTPTLYTQQYWAQTQEYGNGSYRYGLGPVGAVVGGLGAAGGEIVGANVGAPSYGMRPHASCGVTQDFNGRYTSMCGP